MRAINVFAKLMGISFISVSLAACNADEAGKNNVIPESTSRLPSIQSSSTDCNISAYEMDLKEWIQAGDAAMFGTVDRVEPALDLGWTDLPGHEKGIRQLDRCDNIESAFKVHLKDVKGYFHDQEVPKELTVYFGFAYMDAWLGGPEVTENSIVWPQGDLKIEQGMRIGGMLVYDQITQRWGFDLAGRQPIFQVNQDKVYAQQMKQKISGCGAVTPVGLLESMTEAELHTEIAKLDADSDLFNEPKNRKWSPARLSDGKMRSPGNWMGVCWLPLIRSVDECVSSDNCDESKYCDNGHCYPKH